MERASLAVSAPAVSQFASASTPRRGAKVCRIGARAIPRAAGSSSSVSHVQPQQCSVASPLLSFDVLALSRMPGVEHAFYVVRRPRNSAVTRTMRRRSCSPAAGLPSVIEPHLLRPPQLVASSGRDLEEGYTCLRHGRIGCTRVATVVNNRRPPLCWVRGSVHLSRPSPGVTFAHSLLLQKSAPRG